MSDSQTTEVENLRLLLKQAIEFDGQTVRDYRKVREWARQAMSEVGGYDISAEEKRKDDRQAFINGVFHDR